MLMNLDELESTEQEKGISMLKHYQRKGRYTSLS